MNKSALRTFATNARRELLEKVQIKARKIGITDDKIKQADVESSDAVFIDGRQLSAEEKKQRQELIKRIEQKGFNQVMEEVAYTWFNRFTALRFMEVNEYLPSDVRVLSSSNPNDPTPDIIKEALSLDFEIDKEWVYERKLNNENDKLFQYLIIKQCNDLYDYLPFMFEKIDDYSEILFPEGLLSNDTFLRDMTNTKVIPEEYWMKVEIIGWLYQFYIAEEKDKVFNKGEKYRAEEIPYATQLFTPNWIVKYMVQNSLGRYWIENHPKHGELIDQWEFYIEQADSYEIYNQKFASRLNKDLRVEDIKCLDPAMGSGHILVYMFEVLYQIYILQGYQKSEIPRLIIENNLYGLDIDERAYQLACFSIVMKAMKYNSRFLLNIKNSNLKINLASIEETDDLIDKDIEYLINEPDEENLRLYLEQFYSAKTIGSLINVTNFPEELLNNKLREIHDSATDNLFLDESREKLLNILPKLIKQSDIMTKKYEIVVTNPPYMGASKMNPILSEFVKNNYTYSKADLFGCFMEIDHYLKENGFYACINQHSWMFLNKFEKLRERILKNKTIENMLHLGPRTFEEIGGEVVQSTSFVLRNYKLKDNKSVFIRLVEGGNSNSKMKLALENIENIDKSDAYFVNEDKFSLIPGNPVAYWSNREVIENFRNNHNVKDYSFAISKGIYTGKNKRFIRYWFEVSYNDITNREWNKYSKGGGYRKWYGNSLFVVNWKDNASELRNFKGSGLGASRFYDLEHIVWTKISSNNSFRYDPADVYFDDASPAIIFENGIDYVIFAILNSKVAKMFLNVLAPTLNFQIGDIKRIPINNNVYAHKDDLARLVKECIEICKADWDNFEVSWDFSVHPLLKYKNTDHSIEESVANLFDKINQNFKHLEKNEVLINEIIINSYNLSNHLKPDIEDEFISYSDYDKNKLIRTFISYAVGCMLGRYSLDEEGLISAGGQFDISNYQTFKADEDNILPIVDSPYFEDDIVSRFIDFVKLTFSKETLEENLDFIADTLGRRNNETARETIRRYFLNEFFKDHVQTYKKHPIYWQFTSGKHKAFNCLVYMHRYDPTLLGRIRTDYLHEVQTRMDAEKEDLLRIIEGDSTPKEQNQAKKDLETLEKKIEELKAYDEKLHHMADQQIEIDLDDGVEVNYAEFNDLLAKK